MKMIIKVFYANGNPFMDLAGCMPKILHSVAIIPEQGDQNNMIVAALNKYSQALTKTPFNFKPNEGVQMVGAEATKLFMSDLKYNVVSKYPDLATLKVEVRFDPTNKKLMSLDALCNSLQVYSQAEIDNNYQALADQLTKSEPTPEAAQNRPK